LSEFRQLVPRLVTVRKGPRGGACKPKDTLVYTVLVAIRRRYASLVKWTLTRAAATITTPGILSLPKRDITERPIWILRVGLGNIPVAFGWVTASLPHALAGC